MKPIRLHIILFALFLNFSVRGQQDIQLSQQSFSRININPAAIDFSEYANAYLFARQQWIGFEGAPSTQLFSAQGYVDDIRSGVGFSLVSDHVGRNRLFNMMFSYAYFMHFGGDRYLSLGIGAGLFNRRYGGNILVNEPEYDPDIIEMLVNGKSVYRPDMNFGVTYSTLDFKIGISATHLTRYLYGKNDWFKLPLHAYAFAEYDFYITDNMRVTPKLQVMSAFGSGDTVKLMNKVNMLYEFGGLLSVEDKFWLGASFRYGDALVAMIGINLGPNLRMGYSYDLKIGNAFKNIKTYGSHEIMFNYRMRLTEIESAEQTPRFFD
jgi:type IX secretion system PorP/SprF family membrane protein